ncbi:MAG: Transcriptional regulatory protein ZraR [Syntrophorhabdus sp. PtaU1.Bin058]|nr:MAG: Transcriptional regulatory protein ZraR [Syntrophorhabdus sp. PtaU1.Bin058]
MKNKKTEATLTKELLDAMLNNIYLGFTVIDKDGIVRFRNQVSEDQSGIKNEDVLNTHFTNIDEKGQLVEVMKSGVPDFGVLWKAPDGKDKVVNRLPLFSGNKIIGAMTLGFQEKTMITRKYDILEQKLEYYKNTLKTLQNAKYNVQNILGKSEKIMNTKRLILKYSQANAPVLITGATGTGKELCAHAIHLNSSRKNHAFVKVNCASIPRDLFESELFGYESGAFTGANKKGRIGKFELADHGTIFLDEVASLPLEMQPKLLRVLQEREIEKIGGNKVKELDIRFIAASNENLESLVRQNKFREDLYYRIKIFSLEVPSLMERKEDIPILSEHFIKVFNQAGLLNITGISPDVMDIFLKWNWPGNIRELKNVLETAAYLNETGIISSKDLPSYLTVLAGGAVDTDTQKEVPRLQLKKAKKDFERNILEKELNRLNWNIARTAKQLGISRPQLYALLKRYGIKRSM